MNPVDYRNDTWKSIQDRLSGLRALVYDAWHRHGPGTTREVAARSGIDILTFRPRTTELYQLGLVELAEDPGAIGHDIPGGEGVYRSIGLDLAMERFFQRKKELTDNPAQMALL